jgi:hypothetical protein
VWVRSTISSASSWNLTLVSGAGPRGEELRALLPAPRGEPLSDRARWMFAGEVAREEPGVIAAVRMEAPRERLLKRRDIAATWRKYGGT